MEWYVIRNHRTHRYEVAAFNPEGNYWVLLGMNEYVEDDHLEMHWAVVERIAASSSQLGEFYDPEYHNFPINNSS